MILSSISLEFFSQTLAINFYNGTSCTAGYGLGCSTWNQLQKFMLMSFRLQHSATKGKVIKSCKRLFFDTIQRSFKSSGFLKPLILKYCRCSPDGTSNFQPRQIFVELLLLMGKHSSPSYRIEGSGPVSKYRTSHNALELSAYIFLYAGNLVSYSSIQFQPLEVQEQILS